MKKLLKILSTEDGLFFNDFVLSFDSCRSEQVSFLSSAQNPFLDISARIIATEETLRILQVFNRKPSSLVCQYNRAFSVGKLKIELLPSGGILGGSSLFIETEGNTILYAPLMRTKGFPSLRSLQLRPAQQLVINALHPVNNSPKLRRKLEWERLLTCIQTDIKNDRWPIVVCPAVGLAQELTYLLNEHQIPLAVHRSIAKVNKVYESFGSHLGNFSVLRSLQSQRKVILLARTRSPHLSRVLTERPRYIVQDDFADLNQRSNCSDVFVMNLHADFEEIRSIIIPEVRPKRVAFFGPYSRAYAEELRSYIPHVSAVYENNQPVLF